MNDPYNANDPYITIRLDSTIIERFIEYLRIARNFDFQGDPQDLADLLADEICCQIDAGDEIFDNIFAGGAEPEDAGLMGEVYFPYKRF